MRLIDADALRQVLEVFTEKNTLGHTPLQLCDAMPTVNQWRSVDEPPDTDEYVHAFDGAFVGMASFDGEKWWQHDTFESFIISPSYWMPRIPDPPKEKTMKGE